MDDLGVRVGGVMGTSAGALTGSLYAAGYTPRETLEILCKQPPYQLLALPTGPYGALSLQPVIERLREVRGP